MAREFFLLVGFFLLAAATGSGEEQCGVASDVRYIRCATCELLVAELHESFTSGGSSGRSSEGAASALIEEACDPEAAAGGWLRSVDMVEDHLEQRISLQRQPLDGPCGRECQTVKMACEGLLEEALKHHPYFAHIPYSPHMTHLSYFSPFITRHRSSRFHEPLNPHLPPTSPHLHPPPPTYHPPTPPPFPPGLGGRACGASGGGCVAGVARGRRVYPLVVRVQEAAAQGGQGAAGRAALPCAHTLGASGARAWPGAPHDAGGSSPPLTPPTPPLP